MTQLLPCPTCGHQHTKPSTRTKFKCKNKGCSIWLELSEDFTQLQDHYARKAADKASKDNWWHQQALIRQRKLNTDYETAKALVLAEHNANTQRMREEARVAKLFPPDAPTPAPKTQTFTNNTKPIVAMSTTTDDDTDAPF
jgi:hypothetical protein